MGAFVNHTADILAQIEGEFPQILPIRESLIKYVFEPAAAQVRRFPTPLNNRFSCQSTCPACRWLTRGAVMPAEGGGQGVRQGHARPLSVLSYGLFGCSQRMGPHALARRPTLLCRMGLLAITKQEACGCSIT